MALKRLEPCAGKLARTVLRRVVAGNSHGLSDNSPKLNQLDSAQQAMMTSLAMAPNRATAWSNLGDVYAFKNDKSRAVACLANAYRFSRNREKTHQFFKSLNEKENVEQLKQARNEAISWAEKTYFIKQSTFETDPPEITDKRIAAQNQRKQNIQDDYMQSESVTEKTASYSSPQTERNNEQSSVDIANFKTCISGQYVSLCKHDLLTNEQATQVDAAEKRVNFNTCISGQYPSLCKHNLLTHEQSIRVDEAERYVNFNTCITGQYPSLCKHSLLTDEQAIRVEEAEKRVNLTTCISGQYASLCKHNLLTNEQAIQVDAAEKRVNFNTCITGQYPSLCKHDLLTHEQAIQVNEAERRAK